MPSISPSDGTKLERHVLIYVYFRRREDVLEICVYSWKVNRRQKNINMDRVTFQKYLCLKPRQFFSTSLANTSSLYSKGKLLLLVFKFYTILRHKTQFVRVKSIELLSSWLPSTFLLKFRPVNLIPGQFRGMYELIPSSVYYISYGDNILLGISIQYINFYIWTFYNITLCVMSPLPWHKFDTNSLYRIVCVVL